MLLNSDIIHNISRKYGESFYILNSNQFKSNFIELQKSFRDIYESTYIAYSYKTNYTPKLCKLVNELGGYAEVVSDMECNLAYKIGVSPKNIIFNGPYKNPECVKKLLLDGGTVNIDSQTELNTILEFAKENPDKTYFVGVRCNFDIDDGVLSRFGFDVTSRDFDSVINSIRNIPNLVLKGLHCHFATRSIMAWENKTSKMIEIVNKYYDNELEYISLGGGLFGKMGDELKAQFPYEIPTYNEYASITAKKFYEAFRNSRKPKLIIEPGSALVGDAMKFAAKVINIKDIRGKKIATVLGSMYNINPTLNSKNLPLAVYHDENNINAQQYYTDLNFGGFTCIESDYLYKNYSGNLAVGDYVVFDNVGSYSVVLKPPFILPNFAVVDYDDEKNTFEVVKRREFFDDIFRTFMF